MSLRDQLQAIHEQHGHITPALVVDTARDESHPLHERFEWDDKQAGEAYRLHQARQMIRSVRVVYREADEREGERSVRAYHAVRTERGNIYQPADEIVSSPFLTQLLLRDMERDWQQLKRRWARFSEFTELIKKDLGSEGEAA